MLIERFRHKGLRRLYEDDDSSGLPAQSIGKIKAILAALEFAADLSQVATMPGWRLHRLRAIVAANTGSRSPATGGSRSGCAETW
jgi:plasmid maintenance system killer protein